MNTDAALVAQLEREIDTLIAKYDELYASTQNVSASIEQFVAVDTTGLRAVHVGDTIPAGTFTLYYSGSSFVSELRPSDAFADTTTILIPFKMWAKPTVHLGQIDHVLAAVSVNLPTLSQTKTLTWDSLPEDGFWIPVIHHGVHQYQRIYYSFTDLQWYFAEIQPEYTIQGKQTVLTPTSFGLPIY